MLAHRLRRRPNIVSTLAQRRLLVGLQLNYYVLWSFAWRRAPRVSQHVTITSIYHDRLVLTSSRRGRLKSDRLVTLIGEKQGYLSEMWDQRGSNLGRLQSWRDALPMRHAPSLFVRLIVSCVFLGGGGGAVYSRFSCNLLDIIYYNGLNLVRCHQLYISRPV